MTTPPPPPYYVRHAVYNVQTGAYIDSEAGSVSGDEPDDVPRRSSHASDLEHQAAVRPPPRWFMRWCPCWFDVRWIHGLVSLLATAAILAVLIGPALYRHEHKTESWLD